METDEVIVILIGNNQISANTIHLFAAQLLIAGVLSGSWMSANAEAEAKRKEERERKPC